LTLETGLDKIFPQPCNQQIDNGGAAYSDQLPCKDVSRVVNAHIDPRKRNGERIENHGDGKKLFNQDAPVKEYPDDGGNSGGISRMSRCKRLAVRLVDKQTYMLQSKAWPGPLNKRFKNAGCDKIREADSKKRETDNDKALFSPPDSNKQSCE